MEFLICALLLIPVAFLAWLVDNKDNSSPFDSLDDDDF